MKSKSVTIPYVLLFLWALISFGYYVAGAAALREEFFHSAQYARRGFDVAQDGVTLNDLKPEAVKAGLLPKDVLLSVNGHKFTGDAQLRQIYKSSKPGSTLTLSVRHPDGKLAFAHILLAPSEGPGFTLAGYAAFLLPILGVPLLGILIGYWIVAARPHDLNAWLVLVLLSFTQTAFGNLDVRFWGGAPLVVFGLFGVIVQVFVFAALLWFGIYFPERWRADRRWPWVKWLIFAVSCCLFVIELRLRYASEFAVDQLTPLLAISKAEDKTGNWLAALCVVIFLIALIDKWRTASTADARRRVRVLAIGSALSLGPMLLIFTVTPFFGIDAHHGNWFVAIVPLVALFPLTLAYVVVVQRAMDVRILLRMGTRYFLAKTTILLLQAALVLFVLFRFVLPFLQRNNHPVWEWLVALAVVALLVRFVFMRTVSGRASSNGLIANSSAKRTTVRRC